MAHPTVARELVTMLRDAGVPHIYGVGKMIDLARADLRNVPRP